MSSEHEHYARHGGVHFIAHVPENQINRYIGELPEEKRESLYEVMKELENKGWISIVNDGVFADGEGKIGGSADC